jgi:hypothetical protein
LTDLMQFYSKRRRKWGLDFFINYVRSIIWSMSHEKLLAQKIVVHIRSDESCSRFTKLCVGATSVEEWRCTFLGC